MTEHADTNSPSPLREAIRSEIVDVPPGGSFDLPVQQKG
jgi:hypothetical protein